MDENFFRYFCGVIFVRKVEKKEEYTRFGATRVEYFGFGPTGFTTLV